MDAFWLSVFCSGQQGVAHLTVFCLMPLNTNWRHLIRLGGLEHCPSLKTLTLLDNNLSRISNLHVVSATLISLCLCDQNITKMENLKLPNLRELYLHRNQISEIENLQYCPKLRKFWIFQVAPYASFLSVYIYLDATSNVVACCRTVDFLLFLLSVVTWNRMNRMTYWMRCTVYVLTRYCT